MTSSPFRTLPPLDQIELALRECQYEAVVYREAGEDDFPVQQLWVLELKDQKGQDYPVRLYYLDEITAAFLARTSADLAPDPYKILCMALHLPFEVLEIQLPELAPLVAGCNTLLPGVYLTLGSEEGLILQYRYIHAPQQPDLKVVVEMIDVLMAYYRSVLPLFWRYFKEGESAADLMQDIQKQWQKAEGVAP